MMVLAALILAAGPFDAIELTDRVSTRLRPGEEALFVLPAASTFRIAGPLPRLRLWQREGGGEAPLVDRAVLLLPDPDGGATVVAPTGRGSLYLLELGPGPDASVHLQRVDSAAAGGDPRAWALLEQRLASWAEDPDPLTVPIPWWVGSEIEGGIEEVALLAAALREVGPPRESAALLSAAAARVLERGRPLAPPSYRMTKARWDEKHGPEPRVLASGESLQLTAGTDLVVRLGFAHSAQSCSRARIEIEGEPIRILQARCPPGPPLAQSFRTTQVSLPAGRSLRLQAESGPFTVALAASRRVRSLRSLFMHHLRVAGRKENATAAEQLAQAEALRLFGERAAAQEAFATIRRQASPGTFLAAYARFRHATLEEDGNEAALALAALAEAPHDSAAGNLLARHALEGAMVQSLLLDDHATALRLAELHPTAIPPWLAAALGATLSPSGLRDRGLALLLGERAARPQLIETGRRLQDYLPRLDRSAALPLEGGRQRSLLEPAGAPSGWRWSLLTAVGPQPLTLRIPEPPSPGAYARVPIVVFPTAPEDSCDEVAARLTVDGEPLSVPLAQPLVERDLVLAAGEHEVVAACGRVLVGAPAEGAALYRLRRYTTLAAGDSARAPVADSGTPGQLQVSLLLPEDAGPGVRELELCIASSCYPLRLRAAPETSDGAPSHLPVRLLFDLPAAAEEVRLRRMDREAGDLFAAVSVRARGDAGEEGPHWLKPDVAPHLFAGGRAGVLSPELLLHPSPEEKLELGAALAALRGGDTHLERLDEVVARLGVRGAPLATWVRAVEVAPHPRAADQLAELATAQPELREMLLAQAALRRLPQDDPEQWLLACAEATAAGHAPRSLAPRRAACGRTAWQRIPIVLGGAGRQRLQAPSAPSTASTTSPTPPKTSVRPWVEHLTTAEAGLSVTVLGPTVVRIAARPEPASTAAELTASIDAGPTTSLYLPAAIDPAVQRASGKAPVGARQTLLLPVLARGPQRLTLLPRAGSALVSLSLRAPKTSPSADETVDEEKEAPSPSAALSTPPAKWLATRPPAASLSLPLPAATLAPPPFTTVAEVGAFYRQRQEGSMHRASSPYLPIDLSIHRRLLDSLWLQGGAHLALRSASFATIGASGRLDFGSGPGVQASLSADAATQRLGARYAWGGRARLCGGYELALADSLAVRGLLGLRSRYVSRGDDAPQGKGVDPAVYSVYGRDHPWGAEGRITFRFTPFSDLSMQATAGTVSNADFATLDGYDWSVRADTVQPPFFGGLELVHARRLGDVDRFLPYSLNEIGAVVGAAFWLSAGQRLVARARVAYRFETREPTVEAAVAYELTFERGLSDLSPRTHLFRALWAEREPGDWEVP